jgi:hypothetical protein
MSKMGLHDSFGHFKHKLWPKEGPGVKLDKLCENALIDHWTISQGHPKANGLAKQMV